MVERKTPMKTKPQRGRIACCETDASIGTTRTVSIDGHVVELEVSTHGIELTFIESPYLTDARLFSHDGYWNIYFNDSLGEEEYEVASMVSKRYREDADTLFLYHLDIPAPERGHRLGSLTLAIMHGVCELAQFSRFAIKFGRAESGSIDFLYKLGFDTQYVDVVDDSDYPHKSAVVGEVSRTDDVEAWALDPIPVEKFATSFFETD